jgi:hypothetical protein
MINFSPGVRIPGLVHGARCNCEFVDPEGQGFVALAVIRPAIRGKSKCLSLTDDLEIGLHGSS